MRFLLFLLVNAMLFIRPAEFAPALLGWKIYEACILSCLGLAYPVVLKQWTTRSLVEAPLTACVVGLLAAIGLSDLVNLPFGETVAQVTEFVKLLLYYFLLVGLVDTPKRLKTFLASLAIFAAIITALAVAHYHGWVRVPAIEFLESTVEEADDSEMVRRLGSTGLFADPNDMCLMLVMSMVVCAYQILENRRWLWAAPLFLFGHAFTLTHSRGGFLGLLAAVTAALAARFGRKAVLPGALVLPVLFLVFAGRQTNITVSATTGQSRLQLWTEGLALFVHNPVFGIGTNRFQDFAGHVAHNSFIHAYTEMGFPGGTLFTGAFALALWGIARLGGEEREIVDPDLRALRPYVLGIVAGYVMGMMSLSQCYLIPTYLVLGVAAVFVRMAETEPALAPLRFDGRLAGRLALLSLGFVAAAQIGIRILGRSS